MSKKSTLTILLIIVVALLGAFVVASISTDSQPAQISKALSVDYKKSIGVDTKDGYTEKDLRLIDQGKDIVSAKPVTILPSTTLTPAARTPVPTPPLVCAAPPSNMVSWWAGDFNGSDLEVTNDGTLENGASIITAGKVDSAIRLDGVNDFVLIPDDPSLTPVSSAFTFDFWLKPDANSGERTIVRKFKEYYIGIEGDNIIFEVYHPVMSGFGNQITTTTNPINNGQWNFVAVTYNGPSQSMEVYINGSYVNTVNTSGLNTIPTNLLDSVSDLTIGMSTGYPDNALMTDTSLNADIDEVEFFDRALDQVELDDIYSSDSFGKCKEKVILMGGSNGSTSSSSLNDIWVTNNMTDWEQVVPNNVWSSRMVRGLGSSLYLDGKIWVIGGQQVASLVNEVWWSSNGVVWNQTPTPNWSPRIASPTLFNNKMWLLGGVGNGSVQSDTWSSLDGIIWNQEAYVAPWGFRGLTNPVVLNNKLWILGGSYNPLTVGMNDIWSSNDGISWALVNQNAPWGGRRSHTSLSFNGKLWVLGGRQDSDTYNDVWSSSDGVTWTQEIASAPWGPRGDHTALVFRGKLWVLGGLYQTNTGVNIFYNDVWSSPDGVNWTQEVVNAPWSERGLHATVVVPNSFGQ